MKAKTTQKYLSGRDPTTYDTVLGNLLMFSEDTGLPLNEEQIYRLSEYLKFMKRWNQTYNLTAISCLEKMVAHHIFDSLVTVEPLTKALSSCASLNTPSIYDVGCGPGLPGVVLAIMRPHWKVNCIDSVKKKLLSFCRSLEPYPPLILKPNTHA